MEIKYGIVAAFFLAFRCHQKLDKCRIFTFRRKKSLLKTLLKHIKLLEIALHLAIYQIKYAWISLLVLVVSFWKCNYRFILFIRRFFALLWYIRLCIWRTLTQLFILIYCCIYRISSLSGLIFTILLHNLHKDKRFPFNKNVKFIANPVKRMRKKANAFFIQYYYVKLLISLSLRPHQTLDKLYQHRLRNIKVNCNWSVVCFICHLQTEKLFCFIVHENHIATEALPTHTHTNTFTSRAVCGSCAILNAFKGTGYIAKIVH